MKRAQIITIAVAVLAGGGALYLAQSPKPAPAPIVQISAPPPPPVPMEDILVASHEIALGAVLGDPDLQWSSWPRDSAGPGMIKKSELPNAMEDIKGAVVRGNFYQGEPIRREKIVKGPNSGFLSAILTPGKRAVAINIDATGATTAGGFVLPNDHVDILRTRRDEDSRGGATDVFVTEVLVSNVRVLAIGPNIQEKNGERVVNGSNATLEVDPADAELLLQAQRTGQLSMSLRSMRDVQDVNTVDPNARPPQANGVTLIRYGVATTLGKK
jgi:pilus assembly protein CpaB